MANERKKLIKKLDNLIREIVLKRDKFTCQRCGSKTKQLNVCHFYSRRIKSLRWEKRNLVVLDVGCHFYFHQHPAEFTEWFKDFAGEKNFEILRIKQHNTLKTSIANLGLIEYVLRREYEDKCNRIRKTRTSFSGGLKSKV